MNPELRLRLWNLTFCFVITSLGGCGDGDAAAARKAIREKHVPSILRAVRGDMQQQREGMRDAAQRLAPGFVVEDVALRERQMRSAMKRLQEPPRGIIELIQSPMSFLAAVDRSGVVIARDAEPDRMKGTNFGARYAVVRETLDGGREGFALVEFPSTDGSGESSWSLLFTAPVRQDDEVLGAVVSGIPLWRMAQRLSRQLQMENASERGVQLWALPYKGERVFEPQPLELTSALPNGAARAKGLGRSPAGYSGVIEQYGRTYAFGVMPIPLFGSDVGVILIRAEGR